MTKTLRIYDGYRLVMELYSPYRTRIYKYNSTIRESGYYLKPLHIVYKVVQGRKLKYIYFGRYWYRVYKAPAEGKQKKAKSRIKWLYIGRDKPDPHLPDPPINPLEGIAVIVDGNDVLVDERTFEALTKISKAVLGENLFESLGT